MPEEITLNIEKLVYGGDGLARFDGRVVFVPFVLPGEAVRATVIRAKNDLLRGNVRQMLQSSGHRVDPPCPYFYRCGGCQYQHSEYAFQLAQKAEVLRDVLRRVGKVEFEGEIEIVSGEPWHYRNRVQLHIHAGRIGYFEPASHRLCAIDHCPISSEKLNDAIGTLSRDLPHFRFFDTKLELFTNESQIQVNLFDRIPASIMPLFDSIGTRDPIQYGNFRVSRGSFFQVNRFLVDRLVEVATNDLSGEVALDLYAGVGLFSRRLSQRFRRVIAVESGWSAFRDLEFNVTAEAKQQPVEDFLATCEERPDLVLADPPRTGLGDSVIASLLRIQAPRLVIVACDPATLARDLRRLVEAEYKIEQLTMVDLFPQTAHLETVVRLGLDVNPFLF